MPDLGSQVLETAIGLAFVFFLLSIIVSAITETFAWFVGRRATDLEAGLKQLLADPARATAVLDHPLVKRLGKPETRILKRVPGDESRRKPSYLPARTFALTLLETLAPDKPKKDDDQAQNAAAGDAEIDDDSKDLIEEAGLAVSKLGNKELRDQLLPMIEAADADRDDLRKRIETWFDDGMDRVSGWYRRWAQLITLIAALVVTVGLNVDSTRVVDRMWNDDTVRAGLVASASAAAQEEPATDESALVQSGNDIDGALHKLEASKLPFGWSHDNGQSTSLKGILTVGAGWLITFFAISLGAPFWFDALGKLSRLRTTGGKPEPSSGDTTKK
jgi:hypothetical protein